MSGIARFVGGLFNPRTAKMPSPVGPAPNIGDAAGQADSILTRARSRAKTGFEDTSLATPTLGGVGKLRSRGTSAPRPTKSILG